MENEMNVSIEADEQAEQELPSPTDKTKEEKPEAGPDKKYTDEDVNKIIDEKFAKWQRQQEAKIDEAKKLERMNEQQKAEYERDQLQARLDELEQENNASKMQAVARTMLKEADVQISDDLLIKLIADDADSTKANIQAFAEMYKADVDKAVAERLRGKTPAKMAGGKMSREDILNIKDKDERRKAIANNLNLFE